MKIKARDNCHACGKAITWGKPMDTGNGNVIKILKPDELLDQVIVRAHEGGITYALSKNVFATFCSECFLKS